MAITRTAKGTAGTKVSGTTLTISGVSFTPGSTLVVGIAWEEDHVGEKPAIKRGNKDLKFIASSQQKQGDTFVRLYKRRIKKGGSKDIVATWPSNHTARAMFATQITESSAKDVQQSNGNASGTSPATGTAVTSTIADTISIAAFASVGPTNDTAATAGAGHTIGQRVGTSGAPPASNITLQETYEILSATGNVRSTLTLTTAREVAATIVAFKATQTYTIVRATYHPFDGNPESESIAFVLKDETTDPLFTVHIPRHDFEEMSDTEVEDYIRNDCQWRADKDFDNAASPDFDPDATFDTRVSSFVNDTFKI